MQRSAVPVEGVKFTDRYGDTRLIHHNQSANGPLRVKRTSVTPALQLNPVVAELLGQNVRRCRMERGYTMLDLAERAGLRGGKQAIWAIENAFRSEGVRLGTLYALAIALETSVINLLPAVREVRDRVEVDPTPRLAVKP